MISLFGLPLTSTVLLVLAGILIGHLLWYPDRRAADEKIDDAEDRYERAKGSARERKARLAELQKANQAQAADLARMQESHDSLAVAKNELEELHAQLQTEAREDREQRHVAEELYGEEQKRCQTLVGELQEALRLRTEAVEAAEADRAVLKQITDQKQHLNDQIGNLQKRLSSLSDQQSGEIETLRQGNIQLEQLRDELANRDNELANRDNQIERLTAERDRRDAEIDAQLGQIESLRNELKTIDTVRNERDELSTELRSTNDTLEKQRQREVAQQLEIDRLRDDAAAVRDDLQQVNITLDETVAARDEAERNVAAIEQELDRSRRELEQTQNELAQARGETDGLAEDLETHQAENRQLADSLAAQIETATHLQSKLDQLIPMEAALIDVKADIGRHRDAIATAEATIEKQTAEIEQLENENRSLQSERAMIPDLRKELNEARDILVQQRTVSEELAQRCESQVAEIERLHREQADLCERLDAVIGERELMESEFAPLREKALRVDQAETLAATAKQAKIDALADRDVAAAERDKTQRTNEELDKALAGLRRQVTSQASRIEKLQLDAQAKDESLEKLRDNAEQSRTGLFDQLQQATAESAGIRSQLTTADEQIRSLEKDNGDLRVAIGQNETTIVELQRRVSELLAHLKRVSGEHEDSLEANAKALARVQALETELHQHAEVIRDLRRQRASIRGLDNPDDSMPIKRAA